MNQRHKPEAGKPPITFQELSRLIKARLKEFTIQGLFKFGYRNKEDVSNLPANTLVVGSQNVLTNAAEQVAIRQGYTLDGPAGTQNTYGIDSSYDFLTRNGSLQNMRKWGTTLEVRYLNPITSTVSWLTLMSTLNAANVVNFTSFWDQTTELKTQCLFVNGDTNLYLWTGGIGSFASATSSTIVLSGTLTTSQLGYFDNNANSANFKLLVDGIVYTYTGVSGQTFTGVTPDPTLASIAVGDAVIQQVVTIANSGISGLPSGYIMDLISTLSNQIWYGSKQRNDVYVSKTNNYLDTTFSIPRLPGEGAQIVLDSAPVGFSPQGLQMYASAGRDQWWVSETQKETIAINNVAVGIELLYMARLKTSNNQGAQSQSLIVRFKNSLVYVSNEQIVNALGLVKNVYSDPQVVNMSDPIKYDIDAYTFTGGQAYYDNYFIYVTVPVMGIVRMYNVNKKYWEAPQTIPISRFYHATAVVGSVLYGHSSLTNESYQLFTGYNDNGNPIDAVAAFPYVSQEGGPANQQKNFDKLYTEGYISGNSSLMVVINYDFGGYGGNYSTTIKGNDSRIIFNTVTDGSLGRNTLGAQPIGSILNLPNQPANPKFRVINTFPRVNAFEYQIVYSSNDVDQQWALLRFGPAISEANDLPTSITL